MDLDFDHSAASLPIPDKKISHQEYFQSKGITLEYPSEKPMIVVEGRQKRPIYLPPELVTVRIILFWIATFLVFFSFHHGNVVL